MSPIRQLFKLVLLIPPLFNLKRKVALMLT